MTGRRKTLAILAAILLLAAGLRLVNIGKEPYWGDEILSLDIVTSFGDAAAMTRYLSEVEFHPPLFYLMMRPWVAAFGESEAATRALSLLFGVASVAAVFALSRALFRSGKAALLASFLMAVMPFQVEFGQEARPYAMLVFFAALAMLGLWRYLRERRPEWLVLYAASSVVMLYLHYAAVFFLAASASWWLVELVRAKEGRARLFMEAAVAHAVVFLGFYPWLSSFLYKLELGRHPIFGLDRKLPGLRVPAFFESVYTQLLWPTKERFAGRFDLIGQTAFKGVMAAALWTLAKRGAASREEGAGPSPWAFLAWFAVLPAALFLLSPQSVPYSSFYQRHVIFIGIPLAAMIAGVLSKLRMKEAAAALAVLLVSFIPSMSVILGDDSLWDRNHRYEEAGEYISEHYKEGDLVVVSLVTTRSDLEHYLSEGIPVDSLVPYPHYGLDAWNTKRTLGLMENEAQVRLVSLTESKRESIGGEGEAGLVREKLERLVRLREPKRVWLYAFSPSSPAHRWFKENGWRHAIRQVGGLFRVDLYEAP